MNTKANIENIREFYTYSIEQGRKDTAVIKFNTILFLFNKFEIK